MAQAGYTPISLYYSTTAAAVPTAGNLANGELGINIQDEKLYFKNAAGTVKLLASNATSAPVLTFSAGTTGFTPSTATSGAITLAGTLATTNGGTGLTSFTSGGVVYASSTSALATGSALTFDGTNLGVGTTSPSSYSAKLAVVSTAADTRISVVDDVASGRGGYLRSNFSDAVILGTTSGVRDLVFSPDNTERMRINTTGNVGIGTSSPSERLVVSGGCLQVTGNLQSLNRPSSSVMDFLSGGTRFFSIGANSSTYGSFSFRNSTTTVNSEVMAIDSSGNLGLGVTPSAWNTGYKAFVAGGTNSNNQVGGIASGSGITIVSTNYYRSSTPAEIYAGTGYAMKYVQTSGEHQWHTAPSGTAGNPITFNQAMTLNVNGLLAIGTTQVNTGLSVWKANAVTGYTIGNQTGTMNVLDYTTPSAVGVGGRIVFGATYYINGNTMGTGYIGTYKENAPSNGANEYDHSLTFGVTSQNYTSGREVGRFSSVGYFGIGRTDPAYMIDAYDVSTGVTTMRLLNTYGLVTSNAYGYSRFQGLSAGNGLFLSQNVNGINGASSVLDSSSHSGYAISMGENYGGWAFLKYAAGAGTVTPSVPMFLTSAGNLLVGATAVGNGGKLYVNGSISLGTTTGGTQSSMAKDTTQLTASISTSATTIYTDISSGMSSASAGYFIIHGSNNAGAGFMDVVIAKASGTPVVVSSSTIEGSPAARTYSVSSFALQLAMASGTYNVNLKATVLGYPF
jgi:hypothetical protein